MEIWKDCKHYEGLYLVSNEGRLFDIRHSRYMCLQIGRGGVLKTRLTNEYGQRKNELVHRLVAMAFIDNPENLPCVIHKNSIVADNRVENLRWGLKSEVSENVKKVKGGDPNN